MNPRRHAGAPEAELRDRLLAITRDCAPLMQALRQARALNLPDWWLVSGAIYGQVWNHLTGRPDLYGVKDIDLFYFDPDTSWEAEDRIIRRAAAVFAPKPPVEVRNQARVPLWYPEHFGRPYPPLSTSAEAIDRFACTTHCVGLRLEAGDSLTLYAPYGLAAIFAMRLVPNTLLDNRETHEAKAARQSACWPELTVEPWPR